MRDGNNDKNNNIEMDILDGGALYKALTVTENNLDGKIPGGQFMISSTMYISNNQMLIF